MSVHFMQREEWYNGYVGADDHRAQRYALGMRVQVHVEVKGDSRHVTAGSCMCQGCSNDVNAGAFRGLIGAVGI
jgi:hypothetical protein